MSSFGKKLRQIREERGKSLSEIADSTKIRRTYLEALETDDFDAFPGKAYGKFFLRAYADAVGFDPEPLLVDYDRAILGPETEPPQPEVEVVAPVDAEPHPWKEKLAETRRRAGEAREPAPAAVPAPVPVPVPVPAQAQSLPVVPDDPSEDPESAEFRAATAPTPQPDLPAAKAPPAPPHPEPVPPAPTPPVVDAPPAEVAASTGRWRWGVAAVLAAGVLLIGWAWMRRGVDEPPVAESATVASQSERTVQDAPRPVAVAEPAPSEESPTAPSPELTTEPEPEPEGDAAERVVEPTASLSIPESGVGQAIVDRRLSEPGNRFEEGTVVVFFTRVLGGEPGATIRHIWRRDGAAVQSIRLNVGAAHWRTHSRKTLWGVGDWSVEAQDAAGNVLAKAEFICVPQESPRGP